MPPPDNYFTVIVQSITELLTRHSDMFVAMGGNLFRGFAIILISWFGAKVALSSSHEHHAFHFGNFASLLLTIAFGFAMITYYDSPIPGFGVSFKDLILDQSYYLARRIEVSTIEEIQQRLTEVYLTMERPTLLRGVYIVHYFLILCAIILAQMAVFAVIAFGYVAMAVIVLVGPIFIPFFIVCFVILASLLAIVGGLIAVSIAWLVVKAIIMVREFFFRIKVRRAMRTLQKANQKADKK